MNLWAGIAMLGIAAIMIWGGRPNKDGVHPSFLRFNAALVFTRRSFWHLPRWALLP